MADANKPKGDLMGRLEADMRAAKRLLSFSGLMGAVGSSVAKTAEDSAKNAALAELNNIKEFCENGHWSWRVLGFLGGVGMFVAGLLEFLTHLLGILNGTFDGAFYAVLDLYILAFGALAAVLEYKDSLIPKEYAKELKMDMLFLYKPYGRAFIFVLFGFLMFCQGWGAETIEFPYLIVGAYIAAVGMLVFYFSMQAENALQKLKADQKFDKTTLRTLFNKADANKNGNLDTKEFCVFMKSLGEDMNCNELESALLDLDADHNGTIDFDEFSKWYLGRD